MRLAKKQLRNLIEVINDKLIEAVRLLIEVQKDVSTCDISFDIMKDIEEFLISEGKLMAERSNHWRNKNVK